MLILEISIYLFLEICSTKKLTFPLTLLLSISLKDIYYRPHKTDWVIACYRLILIIISSSCQVYYAGFLNKIKILKFFQCVIVKW